MADDFCGVDTYMDHCVEEDDRGVMVVNDGRMRRKIFLYFFEREGGASVIPWLG